MRHRIALFLFLFLVLAAFLPVLSDDKPEPLPPMTAERWREDLDFLARELPKRHKNAFHTVTKEQFTAEVTALREKAGEAGDDAMLVGLMRLTAMVGDGHTNVHLPSSLHQLPLSVTLVEGVHRVVRGADAAAALKNAIDFRELAHATLVGEPIGERPNSYSENDEMRLPHSRLQVSYSTRYYAFLPGKDGLVTPDKEIKPTWAEWLAGVDPVLEWILSQ